MYKQSTTPGADLNRKTASLVWWILNMVLDLLLNFVAS